MLSLKNEGIKLIIDRIRPEKNIKKVFVVTLIGSVLGSFVPLIYGQIIRMAGNELISTTSIIAFALMWMTIDQIHNWTTRYADRMGRFTAWDVGCRLFIDGLAHIIRLPMSFLSEQRLGKIVQRLERGTNQIEQIVTDVLFSLIPHFLSLVFSFGIMFYLQWKLGLGVLLIVVLYTLAMVSSNKKILELNREVRKIWEEAWGHMWDVLNNIKAVKASTNEEFEIGRIIDNFNKCYDQEKAIEDLRTGIKTKEHLIFGIGAVSVISLGVLMLRWKMIDAGDLFSFFGYITLAYTPFSRLAHNWRLVQQTIINEERVAKFLAEGEEHYENGENINISGDIEFNNVSFGYDGKCDVLRNLTFTIGQGETVALVGESGVGKTTLVDLLFRYYDVTSGQILIGGRNISDWSLNSLRSQMAMVPQDISLFNDTIRLNLAYGRVDRMNDDALLEEVARASYAHDFITSERFADRYDQLVGERGIKLSAGQRQRIAIGRAIMCDPKVLIMDEATSALDSESEKYVQDALEVLIKSRTTIIIAHRLSTVKKADKIVVLDQGSIAEMGRHEELLAKGGIYKKFVDLQSFKD